MTKLIRRLLIGLLVFSIFVTLQEQLSVFASTDDTDALEDIAFYSSYHNQTLSPENLYQLNTDFFVPTTYQEIQIDWSLNHEFLQLSEERELIELRTSTGTQVVEVNRVSIQTRPTVFQGDQSFGLLARFERNGVSYTVTFQGSIICQMPDDFLGGVTYTFVRYISLFLEGALRTLGISLIGTMIGFFFALFIVTARIMTPLEDDSIILRTLKKGANTFSKFYIGLFRGTPMIVQASFFWYGLGLFGDALLCGLFVVSLNTAAYIAEILRGGIQSVDVGQTEAAKSLGMTYSQTMIFIVFPQAIKHAFPAIGNEFVINIKDTAVLSVIGIFELFNQTRKIAGMHYRQLEAYLVVGIIYLCLTYAVTQLLIIVEKKFDMPHIALTSST